MGNKKDTNSVTDFINLAHFENNSTLGNNLIGKRLGSGLTPDVNFSSAYAFTKFDDLAFYHSDKLNNHRYSRDSSEITSQVEHYFQMMHNNSPCFLFNSGMSAIMASFSVLIEDIDYIVTFGVYYRKTKSIIDNLARYSNKKVLNLNSYSDLENKTFKDKKRILFLVENPSNPFMTLIDLKDLRKNFPKSKLIVDFSLAGLLNHKNLHLADIALTSCTKYIGGHNDFLAGLVIVNNQKYEMNIWQYRSMAGSLCDPLSTFLLLRSLRTYDMRLKKMLENIDKTISKIKSNKFIKKIFYPGEDFNLEEKNIFSQTLLHGGSVITFEVDENLNLLKNMENLRSIKMAPTFGSVDSLVEIPLYMSRGKDFDPSNDFGNLLDNLIMSKNLVRLSIGCEDWKFISADLKILLKSAN